MTNAKPILLIAGVLFAVVGLFWIGQGSGMFPYPASSFMVGRTAWVWYGLIAVALGAAGIWASRRM